MPGLLCSSETLAEPALLPLNLKKPIHRQRPQQQPEPPKCAVFDLPEICDIIAAHLDRPSLTIVVRVCRLWYASWIRHLWRRARVESGTVKSMEMVQAFPRLSLHIRQLEWIHLSESLIPAKAAVHSVDLNGLNLHTLLLSSWSSELDACTLTRFVESSADRMSVLQLSNMANIRGDLLKVAGTLTKLRHISLAMAGQDFGHNHHRQRSNGSSVASPSSASPSPSAQDGVTAELNECTSADSLPALMDACPRLRTIELLDLPTITPSFASAPAPAVAMAADAGVETMATHAQDTNSTDTAQQTQLVFRQWRLMQHLTIINLRGTSISGSTLSVLFSRCPQLIKLNLSQTSPLYLSGFNLEPTVAMCALTSLVLSNCHFLDGHGFKEIFKASPRLTALDMPQTNVDDAALGVLGHQCYQLADLNMDGCQQITDQGIRDMLSHRPVTKNGGDSPALQGPYQNYSLHCLSVSDCTELTGQGIHHILMTCARLRSLEVQQPELLPESLFPHTLETDEDQDQENPSAPTVSSPESEEHVISPPATLYHEAEAEFESQDGTTILSLSWACRDTLEMLRIKNLNFINPQQTQFLNTRLRELSQLKVLHIGGSQLELSVLNGLGHQLENLYIDDLAREVDLDDVRWLVDHTPNLTRLWCRQLIRHSEPWKLLRGARKHLKLW